MVSLILSLLRRIAYFVQICFLDQRDRMLDGDFVGFKVDDCETIGFMNNFFQERLVLKTFFKSIFWRQKDK